MKNGEVGTGDWAHGRWCATCDHHHGWAYPCEHYPADVLEEIAAANKRYDRNRRNPAWRARQVENGVPEYVLQIFDVLAGDRP